MKVAHRVFLFIVVGLLVAVVFYFNVPLALMKTGTQKISVRNQVDGTTKPAAQPTPHKVQLIVRASTVNKAGKKLMDRFFCMAMRTLTLFWSPVYGDTITLIMDDESKADHRFGEILEKKKFDLIRPVVVYEPLPKNPEKLAAITDPNHNDYGYKRQLYSSFFMDRYSTETVLGWIDSDIIFITPATANIDIFIDDRIVAYGASNRMRYGWVKSWFHTVEVALGYPAVADFMTYFPTYLWRDTFSNFRQFATKRFKTESFDEAFYEIYRNGILSPVNILFNYAWHYERERYHWHLDLVDKKFLDYFNTLHKNVLSVKPSDMSLKLHHAVHHGQNDAFAKPGTGYLLEIFEAYCHLKLKTWGKAETSCNPFKDKTHLLQFDFSIETWCAKGEPMDKCKRFIEDNYRRLAPLVRNGTFPFNKTFVSNVEKIAQSMDITCPALGI